MQMFAGIAMRALLIAMAFASIGLVVNRASDDPVPWVYAPPGEVVLAGVKVPLIDEREAAKFLDDAATVFVDSRKCLDYAKAHVRGAVCLPPEDVEQRFPAVEPLIPTESRVILYCYGPECDMAEKVGVFLAQMGYRNLLIMSSGFPAWVKAKYPIDGKNEQDTAIEDPEDIFMEEGIGDQVIASRRFCRCLDPFKAAGAVQTLWKRGRAIMCEPLEILGLARNAGKREIKKRYRLLSKQFHPDLNQNDPEAEERFKKVQWAYETLSGKQNWKGSIETTAARGSNQRSDPVTWSEKPFVGFFQAMKAYAERRRSRSDETSPRDRDDFSSR